MKIRLNIDNQGYTEKPVAYMGAISNRTRNADAIQEIEHTYLADIIQQGRAITPGELTGASRKDWKSQQLICADIDNDEDVTDENGNLVFDENGKVKKRCIAEPTTPDKALQILEENNIKPLILYKTYRYKDEWIKFRIVCCLNEPLTDVNQAMSYTRRIASLFKGTDTSIATPERLLLGGKRDCIIFSQDATNDPGVFEKIADPKKEEPTNAKKSPLNNVSMPTTWNATPGQRTYEDLKAQYYYDIEQFDLVSYVEQSTGARVHKIGTKIYLNPCPVCGHKDDFQVTGALWHCHGAHNNSGFDGGNIITFLQATRNMNQEDAIEFFKWNIMRYDKDEWEKAYERTWKKEQQGFDAIIEQDIAEHNKEPKTDMIDSFLETILSDRFKPVPTGITDIDKALNGGFIKQTVVFLTSAPGMGKTTLAQQILEKMASDEQNVLYFNLEMSREQMLARSFARIGTCGLNSTQILQAYNLTDNEREEVKKTAQLYREYVGDSIKYNPMYYNTEKQAYMPCNAELDKILSSMCLHAEMNQKQGKNAPIVCIDYLHLLRGNGREDAAEIIKRSVDAFKDYAIKYNTIVIVISASNRSANKTGKASMDSGRDTSAIEYSGDLMLNLNYKESDCENGKTAEEIKDEIRGYRERGEEIPEEYKICSLRITKNRFGEDSRRALLRFDGEHSKFEQLDTKQSTNALNKYSKMSKTPLSQYVPGSEPRADIRRKQATRERKRQDLINAYEHLRDTGEVTLRNMADMLGVSQATLKTHIKDLCPDMFKFNGEVVTVEDATITLSSEPEFTPVEDKENPFN